MGTEKPKNTVNITIRTRKYKFVKKSRYPVLGTCSYAFISTVTPVTACPLWISYHKMIFEILSADMI